MEVSDLMIAAKTAASKCMGVRAGEDILIVRERVTPQSIAIAFAGACEYLGASATVASFPSRSSQKQEINKSGEFYLNINQRFPSCPVPETVTAAMKAADGVFIYTDYSYPIQTITDVMKGGTRVLVGYQLTEMAFARTLSIDHDTMLSLARSVACVLTGNLHISISNEAGTSLDFDHTSERELVYEKYLGLCLEPGTMGQLPVGMVSTSPIEGSGRGVVVVDGAVFGVPYPLPDPMRIKVGDHRITEIEGGGGIGKSLTRELESARESEAYNFPAEWGIGLNPASVMGPNVEGETCFGTVHFGIGRNRHVANGKVQSSFHADVNIKEPEIRVDGKALLRKGVFQI